MEQWEDARDEGTEERGFRKRDDMTEWVSMESSHRKV